MACLSDYTKRKCPEDCRYRSKSAPFCGYCLPEIMRQLGMRHDKEEKENGDRQEESSSPVEDK